MLDQTNYARDAMLLHSGTVSQAIYDQAQSTLDTDKSKLESLRQQAQVQLAGSTAMPTSPPPSTRNICRPKRRSKRHNASSITPSSPRRLPAASPMFRRSRPGKYLAASTTAFYLVDTDHAWIEANPKETELTYVRPGQPVTVTVDTYPDVDLARHGRKHQPGGGAGILPAAGAKHQRQLGQGRPARADAGTRRRHRQETMPPLRAGMSAVVDVDTGHARGFPHLFGW